MQRQWFSSLVCCSMLAIVTMTSFVKHFEIGAIADVKRPDAPSEVSKLHECEVELGKINGNQKIELPLIALGLVGDKLVLMFANNEGSSIIEGACTITLADDSKPITMKLGFCGAKDIVLYWMNASDEIRQSIQANERRFDHKPIKIKIDKLFIK